MTPIRIKREVAYVNMLLRSWPGLRPGKIKKIGSGFTLFESGVI